MPKESVRVRGKLLLENMVANMSYTHQYKVDNCAIEGPVCKINQWKVSASFFGYPAVPEYWCVNDADYHDKCSVNE